MKRAVPEFLHQFSLLAAFSEAKPKVDIMCEYMWDLRLQILVTQMGAGSSPCHLVEDMFEKVFLMAIIRGIEHVSFPTSLRSAQH